MQWQRLRDATVILHLVCHGRRHRDQLALLVDDTARDIDGPLEQLSDVLPQVDLAVLSICESAAVLAQELESLVARLISRGVRAVVAPSGALAQEAAESFLDGLYAAVVGGFALGTLLFGHWGRDSRVKERGATGGPMEQLVAANDEDCCAR